MAYIPMNYLSDVLPTEAYNELLKRFNGCLIYVSKKEHENKEDRELFEELTQRRGFTPPQALKRMAEANEKSLRSLYHKRAKGVI